MPRPFKHYPKDLPLETPLGLIKLNVTDGNHIYAECGYMTVLRVEYWVTLHISRQTDGQFNTKDRYSLYTSRKQYKPGDDKASTAAQKKLLSVLIPCINEWAIAHPEVLAAAEASYINNELQRLEEKLASSINSVKDAQKTLSDKLAEVGQSTDDSVELIESLISMGNLTANNDPEDQELEGLGCLVAKLLKWSGEDILEVAFHALEDANFRSEAKQVKDILEKVNERE